MCFESRALSPCGCQETHFHICIDHILHTHKQIDNSPCPKLQSTARASKRMCDDPCQNRSDETYTFEQRCETLYESMNRANKELEEKRRKAKAAFAAELVDENSFNGVQKRVKKEGDQDKDEMKL